MTFLKFFLNFGEQLPFSEAARSALIVKIDFSQQVFKSLTYRISRTRVAKNHLTWQIVKRKFSIMNTLFHTSIPDLEIQTSQLPRLTQITSDGQQLPTPKPRQA